VEPDLFRLKEYDSVISEWIADSKQMEHTSFLAEFAYEFAGLLIESYFIFVTFLIQRLVA
jgi:hypothetical protein